LQPPSAAIKGWPGERAGRDSVKTSGAGSANTGCNERSNHYYWDDPSPLLPRRSTDLIDRLDLTAFDRFRAFLARLPQLKVSYGTRDQLALENPSIHHMDLNRDADWKFLQLLRDWSGCLDGLAQQEKRA